MFNDLDKKQLLDSIEYSLDKSTLWDEEYSYKGFNNDHGIKTLIDGVKLGYEQALFWVANYFNVHDEFVELVTKINNIETEKRLPEL